MSAMKLFSLCSMLLLLAISGSDGAATDPLSKINRLPPSLEEKVQNFQNSVKGMGYEVARGYWSLWSADDCKLPLQTVGFCYGNNPTAPYVLAIVPPWKNEFVDQSLQHTLIQGRQGMTPNYRLGEREALVVFAELPPPARYFGLGTNVFTRKTTLNEDDPVYEKLSSPQTQDLREIIFGFSPNPERMMMIASIGDTINNVVIEKQSKENWGQQRFFVITPDEDMAESMLKTFDAVGVDPSHVLTERLGFLDRGDRKNPALIRLGYHSEADDFITYIRYSMPNDRDLGDQWRAQLPLTILRVRDPKGSYALKPFAIQEYEQKNVNYDENGLKDNLTNLVEAVKKHWNQTGENSIEFKSLSLWVDLIGQHCLGYSGPPETEEGITLPRGPMDCLGDNQDDEPQISGGTYQLDDDQVIAVVGTLGTKTGNATYTSLSVNWFPELVGVLNRDDTVLEESAKKFKDALIPPESYTKFYVYYFARDCSGLYPWCQEVPRNLVPQGNTIKILQRNYINPGSTRAPDPKKVLNPVSIEFVGKKESRPKM